MIMFGYLEFVWIFKVHVICTDHTKSIIKTPFTAMINFWAIQAHLLWWVMVWYLDKLTKNIYRIVKGIWFFRKWCNCHNILETKITKEQGLYTFVQIYTGHTSMTRLLCQATIKPLKLVITDFCIGWSIWHEFCW